MTTHDVILGISTGNFTYEDLTNISNVLKIKQRHLAEDNKEKIKVGDKVSFMESIFENLIEGKILKINKKNVIIEEENFTKWEVPLESLKIIK